ncbi:MAG: hypothetical protein MMC33_001314 [Icmadophila ericetorum]|nr:hypothetical protein [Icmadophila ericetorum]
MAGGHMKYRHLSRSSAHRQALLRNLVTSLFQHESISTTWHKAKEAQRLAEKLITLGKKNTNASWNSAQKVFYKPLELMPKLFNELRLRYQDRPGGYTRVLRLEPLKEDQAPSAILELVDGPRDMRFAMTAKTLVRERAAASGSSGGSAFGGEEEEGGGEDRGIRPITAKNVRKVTRYRHGGQEELERVVKQLERAGRDEERAEERERRRRWGARKERVYDREGPRI